MTRQQALRVLWQRLLGMLVLIIGLSLIILAIGGATRVGALVFLIGNIGGYVGVHRSLSELSDQDIAELSQSWWSIVAPSFVGGVLALVLYLLFMSNILGGDVFPKFAADANAPIGIEAILAQHADGMPSYAKLLFWSFVAGFNQKYVVDIINSIRTKA